MTNTKILPVVSVLLGIMLFVSGLYAYPILLGNGGIQVGNENLRIKGHAVLEVYRADGTLYKVWEGDNALTVAGKNAIAACAAGISTIPASFGSCSPFITHMGIRIIAPDSGLILGDPIIAATNTPSCLIPPCNPDLVDPDTMLTGWKSVGTFEITQTGRVTNAFAGKGPSFPIGLGFDSVDVSPFLNVSPGDRLIATINFNIP